MCVCLCHSRHISYMYHLFLTICIICSSRPQAWPIPHGIIVAVAVAVAVAAAAAAAAVAAAVSVTVAVAK